MPGSINKEKTPLSNHKTNLDAMDGLEVGEAQKTVILAVS